jgi:hypothetical protein
MPSSNDAFAQDPWELREEGPHRRQMHEAYVEHVTRSGAPWLELRGGIEERVEVAAKAIDGLISH